MVLKKLLITTLTSLPLFSIDIFDKEILYNNSEIYLNKYNNKIGKKIIDNLNNTFLKNEILNKQKVDNIVKEEISKKSFKIIDYESKKIYNLLDGQVYFYTEEENMKILSGKLLTFLNKPIYENKPKIKYLKDKNLFLIIKNAEIKYIKIPIDLRSLSFNKIKKVINSI